MESGHARVLRAGLGGAKWMAMGIALQKVVGVVLNQAAAGLASTETLGVASVRMELALSTVLFVSREGFRLALVRTTVVHDASKPMDRSLVKTSWIPALAGMVLAVLVGVIGVPRVPAAQRGREALALYCAAAAVESLSEPLHTLALAQLVVAPRAAAEPAAALARGLTLVYLLRTRAELEAAAFGAAQLVFAVVLGLVRAACWCGAVGFARAAELAPRPSDGIDSALAGVGAGFAAHSVLKHLLTEADRVVLTFAATAADAGVYAVVSNYGALVARLLLQPAEDAARLTFGKLGALSAEAEKDEDRAAAKRQAGAVLFAFSRGLLYLGLLFGCVASGYAAFALRLLHHGHARLGGADAAAAGAALRAYCWYIPCLALNGIFEAFAQATAGPEDLRSLAAAHVACAVAFAAVAPKLLAQHGAVGIVAASGMTMLLRAVFASTLASRYFAKRLPRLADAQFTAAPLAAFAAAWAANEYSRQALQSLAAQESRLRLVAAAAPYLGIAATTAAILLATIYFCDKSFVVAVADLAGAASGRRQKTD
ncbi:Rft protein-domain-containing protein [Pelagophyceae sp. CCMP2097]|nr:Rft protein-domain-containing protein [Pelagophyceae sp. CCMP2097]